MTKYVALLRGINVGGNKKVPMADLRALYESLGFENVKTLLNSGNVVFEAEQADEAALVKRIEEAFQKKFGFESRTMLRPVSEIEKMVDADPFKKIKVDKDTRLYVSFLREDVKSSLKLPYISEKKDFRILKKDGRDIFWVVFLTSMRTLDAMSFMEKEFGKDITTRNWNTVGKIAKL